MSSPLSDIERIQSIRARDDAPKLFNSAAQPSPGSVEQSEAAEKEAKREDIDKFAKFHDDFLQACLPIIYGKDHEEISKKVKEELSAAVVPFDMTPRTPRPLVRSPELGELAKDKQQ